jgi:hypothetical protein
MAKDRDRRDPPGRRSPAKDPVERMAEDDVDKMKKLLQRTKAEVARSNKLADRIERRTSFDRDPDKKK